MKTGQLDNIQLMKKYVSTYPTLNITFQCCQIWQIAILLANKKYSILWKVIYTIALCIPIQYSIVGMIGLGGL
jgi:hypothetical protein